MFGANPLLELIQVAPADRTPRLPNLFPEDVNFRA